MDEWDPIGVRGVPEAQDEYDAYVYGVYKYLVRRSHRNELVDYRRNAVDGSEGRSQEYRAGR